MSFAVAIGLVSIVGVIGLSIWLVQLSPDA
jgi:hypothetical protein